MTNRRNPRKDRAWTLKSRRTSGGSKPGLQSHCLTLAQPPSPPGPPGPASAHSPPVGPITAVPALQEYHEGQRQSGSGTEHNAQGRKHPEKSAVMHLSEESPQKGMPYTRGFHLFWCQEGSFKLILLSTPKNFLCLSDDIYPIMN